MLLADLYRTLMSEETILAGDQWTMTGMVPEVWAPCDSFVGKRMHEIQAANPRLMVRRLIAHETQV